MSCIFSVCRISTPLPNFSSLNLRGKIPHADFYSWNYSFCQFLTILLCLRNNGWIQTTYRNHNNQESSHQDHWDQGWSGRIRLKRSFTSYRHIQIYPCSSLFLSSSACSGDQRVDPEPRWHGLIMSLSLPNHQQKAIRRNTFHSGYKQANKPATHKKQTASRSAFVCGDPVSLLVDTDCILLPWPQQVFCHSCLDTIMKSAQHSSSHWGLQKSIFVTKVVFLINIACTYQKNCMLKMSQLPVCSNKPWRLLLTTVHKV